MRQSVDHTPQSLGPQVQNGTLIAPVWLEQNRTEQFITEAVPCRRRFVVVEFRSGNFDSLPYQAPAVGMDPACSNGIEHIAGLLIEGGKFLMCENSQDGLNSINELRVNIGLSKIEPPWHNRYLNDAEVEELSVPGLVLEDVEYFSSTYYFLSRVVNAWLAIKKAKEPCYDHPVNHLALELPPIGKLGQTRLWIWRKEPLE